MQALVLAGGLGTRLKPLTNLLPKAMVLVHGRPFLEYKLMLLKRGGVENIVLCVGYLGEKIEQHFGDGREFGLRIRYSRDGNKLLGPIGALKKAEQLLYDEFFVTYGDTYLRIDYRKMMDALRRGGKLGIMAVYRNEGRYGRSDVIVRNGFLVDYNKREKRPGMVWINYGVSALNKTALRTVKSGEFCDDEPFYSGLIKERQLLAFEVNERFYEIGTHQSLKEFSDYIVSRLPNDERTPQVTKRPLRGIKG